jgi:5-methylcytosine-specific restriction endonuclease McrA
MTKSDNHNITDIQKPIIKKQRPLTKKYKKKPIPASLKHAVWVYYNGKQFESKCCVSWCPNTVTVFSFEAGHDVPESKGGPTSLSNLRPICTSCNRSMSNTFTIQEYSTIFSASNNTIPVTNPQFSVTSPP